jgi:hypothetical protein
MSPAGRSEPVSDLALILSHSASRRLLPASAAFAVAAGANAQTTAGSGDPARLVTEGRIKTLATGAETDESFNQTIVFGREAGTRKIRCYLHASNKPGVGIPQ